MKRELAVFFAALGFYTRIPVPSWVEFQKDYLTSATRYFPVVGWLVGGIVSGVMLLFLYLTSPLPAVIIGVVVGLLVTGAFHEDGLADTLDGFGGGWTKEKILTIMKDSRLGTFGALALLMSMLLRIALLYEIVTLSTSLQVIMIVVTVHSVSRLMAVVVIKWGTYARDDEQSKAKPLATTISVVSFILALLLGITPLLVLAYYEGYWLLVMLVPMMAVTFYLLFFFKKWIGGFTGDCLGATQQINELIALLSILVVWKFA